MTASEDSILPDDLKFNLPSGYDEQQVIGVLAQHYSIKKEQPVSEMLAFFDTFDWRLFNHSLVLYQSGNELLLRRLNNQAISQRINTITQPVFIEDFPAGQLKEQLASIVEMRALLKLVEMHAQSTPYRILNPDEKTVVRLVYEEIRPVSETDTSPLAVHLWVKPVRGYPRYTQQLASRLKEIGCTTTAEDVYFLALDSVGKTPGDYSAKLDIKLDPTMRADEATKILLRFLLKVMKSNEAYIKKDLDTEFLHDFRVAVRRTRSALSQVKFVFPGETTHRFKKDFAFIGQLSNELRDLDVYLLAEDTYRTMLPDVLRDDINPLFDYLKEKRAKALQDVAGGLNSKDYARILQDWEAFLDEPPPDSPTAKNASLPIIHLARDRIYKRYRGIVKSGQRILEHTEDEMLHALRIECKKLRYLMEFFSSLFPAKKITTLIKQLKKLQENLGDFNDLYVQEEYLLGIAGELPLTDQPSRKAILAIGSLVDALDQERQKVKGAFAKTFIAFASSANKKLFQELFASKKKEVVS
jgi:CHAD domain-containing protein